MVAFRPGLVPGLAFRGRRGEGRGGASVAASVRDRAFDVEPVVRVEGWSRGRPPAREPAAVLAAPSAGAPAQSGKPSGAPRPRVREACDDFSPAIGNVSSRARGVRPRAPA